MNYRESSRIILHVPRGGDAIPKTVTIRVDDGTYRSFVRRAKAENRSLANFIETAVTEHIRECDFADDSEMAELLANADLLTTSRIPPSGFVLPTEGLRPPA